MEKMIEEWKQIKGYGGKYYISNRGRVKKVFTKRCVGFKKRGMKTTHKEYIMTPCDNGNGYYYVQLVNDGKGKHEYIHRLVAEYFLQEETEGLVINHIDYDKRNNNVENLEVCTQEENVRHSAERMKQFKKRSMTNTGIRYVTKRGDFYRVCIKNSFIVTDKRFKTIDEAINYRNEVLNGFGYTV